MLFIHRIFFNFVFLLILINILRFRFFFIVQTDCPVYVTAGISIYMTTWIKKLYYKLLPNFNQTQYYLSKQMRCKKILEIIFKIVLLVKYLLMQQMNDETTQSFLKLSFCVKMTNFQIFCIAHSSKFILHKFYVDSFSRQHKY